MMSTKIRSRVFTGALIALSVSASGCSLSVPREEAISTLDQRLQSATARELPDFLVNPFISATLDPQHCDLQVSGSGGTESITFTPSSSLSTFLKMSGAITTTVPIPPVTFPVGPLNPTYQITVTDLQIQDSANQLLIANGFLHARSRVKALMVHAQETNSFPSPEALLPSVDFNFDPFTISVDIALANGVFSVAAVSIPLPPPMVSCGFANWCAGLVGSGLGSARTRLEAEVTQLLTKELQKPAVLQALVGGLNAFETAQHPAQAGVQGAPSVEPNSLSLVLKTDGSTALSYVVDQLEAPVAPGSCTAAYTDGCDVALTCAANGATPENVVLQRSEDGVTWTDAPTGTSWLSGDSSHDWVASTLIRGYAYTDGNEYFRLCNRNAIDTVCSPAASLVLYGTGSCYQISSGQGGENHAAPGSQCPSGTRPSCTNGSCRCAPFNQVKYSGTPL